MVPSELGVLPFVPTQKKASGPVPSYVNPLITKVVYMSFSFLPLAPGSRDLSKGEK